MKKTYKTFKEMFSFYTETQMHMIKTTKKLLNLEKTEKSNFLIIISINVICKIYLSYMQGIIWKSYSFEFKNKQILFQGKKKY